MPYNKETAAASGRISKRGASKITTEVKERLDEFTEDVYEAIRYGIRRKDIAFVKLWLQYRVGMPRQVTEIHTDIKDFRPIEINFNNSEDDN